jgi:hypothetical protein
MRQLGASLVHQFLSFAVPGDSAILGIAGVPAGGLASELGIGFVLNYDSSRGICRNYKGWRVWNHTQDRKKKLKGTGKGLDKVYNKK